MAIGPGNIQFTYDSYGVTVPNGAMNAVFPSRPESSATDYRVVMVKNTHSTLTMTAAKAWLSNSGGATVAISSAGSTVDVSALVYSSPTTKAAGISLPDIAPGVSVRVAIRRTFTTATAYPQNVRLYIGGSTPL